MLNYPRERFRKLTFRALALRQGEFRSVTIATYQTLFASPLLSFLFFFLGSDAAIDFNVAQFIQWHFCSWHYNSLPSSYRN